MSEINKPDIENADGKYNKEIFRLLLYYKQLNELLETFFSGGLIIVTDEINKNYLRLCNVISEILKNEGFANLSYEWRPFDNLRTLDPDVPEAEWEYVGQQICSNFLSNIEDIFIKNGEKAYPLEANDLQLLSTVKTYLDEYRHYKKERTNKWYQSALNSNKHLTPASDKTPKAYEKYIDLKELLDDFYYDLIENINACYSFGIYPSVRILSRKLLENLLIDLLRNKFGKTEINLFYDTKNSKFHNFNILLKNISEKLEDFKPISPALDPILIKKINKFRELGNSSAHTIELQIKKDELYKEKDDLIFIVKVLSKSIKSLSNTY